LIEQFLGTGAVGIYALTKTLTMFLSFIPAGVTTVLMPKVAAGKHDTHGDVMRNSILLSLGANAILLLLLLIVYRPFITLVFGEAYVVPLAVLLMLALSEISYGVHGIVTAVLVGTDQPYWETVSRVVVVIVSVLFGIIFIPALGLTGAALTVFAGAIAANLTYVIASFWLKRDITHAIVEVR